MAQAPDSIMPKSCEPRVLSNAWATQSLSSGPGGQTGAALLPVKGDTAKESAGSIPAQAVSPDGISLHSSCPADAQSAKQAEEPALSHAQVTFLLAVHRTSCCCSQVATLYMLMRCLLALTRQSVLHRSLQPGSNFLLYMEEISSISTGSAACQHPGRGYN